MGLGKGSPTPLVPPHRRNSMEYARYIERIAYITRKELRNMLLAPLTSTFTPPLTKIRRYSWLLNQPTNQPTNLSSDLTEHPTLIDRPTVRPPDQQLTNQPTL